MKKTVKTNAMRLLDKAKIAYEVYTYDIDIKDFNGEKVSEEIGLAKESCFKTLSLKSDHDLYILCIPVAKTLDLKKSAKNLGVKHLEMIKVKDLLKEVGYERGSTSPIGIIKKHHVCFDSDVLNYEEIEISGGQFGISLKLKRDELLNYLKADVQELCEVKNDEDNFI